MFTFLFKFISYLTLVTIGMGCILIFHNGLSIGIGILKFFYISFYFKDCADSLRVLILIRGRDQIYNEYPGFPILYDHSEKLFLIYNFLPTINALIIYSLLVAPLVLRCISEEEDYYDTADRVNRSGIVSITVILFYYGYLIFNFIIFPLFADCKTMLRFPAESFYKYFFLYYGKLYIISLVVIVLPLLVIVLAILGITQTSKRT